MKVLIDPSVECIVFMVNFMHLVELRVDMKKPVTPIPCKLFNEIHDLYLNEKLGEIR